ncbi:phosphoenolpyruvate synthase, partial [Candidatus Bathyarchaeota archaeon]|nr:phosphoenolpyruvate synthase [Candidatus Bathyarchaeota archaeon]
MISAGIPVPTGFAITAQSYEEFIKGSGISETIYKIITETINDPTDPKQYESASKKIRRLVETTSVPKKITSAIKSAYTKLGKDLGLNEVFVAVRSSATAEDLPNASFAGQQETYLNVRGPDELIEKVVKCWSSLFTPRAIFYRNEKGFAHDKVLISVGVQKMVNSKAAGVMFTINPVTGAEDEIVIEGNYGLGETVVAGIVTPDDFIVDKRTLKIKKKRIGKKMLQYVLDPEKGKTVHLDVPLEKQKIPCISDREVLALALLGKRLEGHYGKTLDIEWAIDKDLSSPQNIFAVQARPETVWSVKTLSESVAEENLKVELIVVT